MLERATYSTHSPKEVGTIVFVDRPEFAVCRHYLHLNNLIRTHSVFRGKRTVTTTLDPATNANMEVCTANDRQTVLRSKRHYVDHPLACVYLDQSGGFGSCRTMEFLGNLESAELAGVYR